jgi:cytochrome c-type biogenesis protein
MLLLLGAIVAGVLTAASPCVLPVLPVVLGGGMLTADVAVLICSLAASVIACSVLLRTGTLLLAVPPQAWAMVSGGLLVALGLVQLLPAAWERTASAVRLSAAPRLLPAGRSRQGARGAAVAGAALGPVFASCSPLYAYVVATALPASPAWGSALLLAYVAGLCGALLAVAALGQRAARRLRWAADPHGSVRRVAGLLFVAVGVAILVGADKAVETWAVGHVPLTGLWTFDERFLPGR